ncbi:hypothetical protein F5B20DRAFT_317522 [Whalleya microplaca]|nr:hypothetical protein F5B20DRAFT_317522 [Whalleya microplaca]
MQIEIILALLSLSALGAAENTVESDDVPSACISACQFTIDLTARCDRQTDDDDTYRPCVCNAQDSQARLTACATCVKDNGMRDADDNDVADLMDDCGWDFNNANASYTSGSTTIATSTGQTTPAVTTTVITSSSGSSVFTTTQTNTGSATGAGSTSSVSTGGAPMATGGVGALIVGGLAIGLPALL